MRSLRAYQHDIVNWVIDHPRCLLLVPMGMGKTVSTLTAVELLSLVEDVFPMLVVAPLRVARTTWVNEVEKFKHLSHLKVSVISGNNTQRLSALMKSADIYTINYENLPWLDRQTSHWKFKTVVADEATRLKSFRIRKGGQRARSLAKHVHKSTRFIGLTGTPAPNGLKDLWGQMWFVDRGRRLGTSFSAFEARWFDRSFDGFSIKPRPYAQEQIERAMEDVAMSLDAREVFDIRDPIVQKIEVELVGEAARLYREMEKQMFIELAGNEIEAFNAAARTMKCLQLASGAIYINESGDYREVHDEKIEALRSVTEEFSGMPLLVAYHFRSDVERILEAFPQARVLDTDPRTIDAWNKGKIPMLLAHPASAGHGLNLQHGGNVLVFFSHWWNLEEYQQIVERIGPVRQAQAGYDRPVFVYHIVAKGTVDEIVMQRRETKREVQDLLMEAMLKRKKGEEDGMSVA